ncbi:YraN family protein [Helicobacter cappadocius]|uniref:UPF0102 protein Q5I04_01895 n=1 Tax=Helicobacter cappadocius TaxID=3063998 RepID=A0AA90T4N9_9HELI|nr:MULTISPECIES: YraN family protein [unclassified Helicobacter]MDO7252671.1 YraN family protein [Helicobacter sp. faydin-H75]MDP2538538.1 YraN family protein [Helicobacter sp. faydin-H76]
MSREKGFYAESLACEYLEKNGYEVVERNFSSRYGEIDIIALKNKILHFIEVKSGQNFEPIYAITPKKISKIIKTIEYYLLQYNPETTYCIDALIIKGEDIYMIENITL